MGARSLQLDNPVRLSIYEYAQLFILFTFDLLIFDTTFTLLQVIGSLIIFVSNMLVLGKTIHEVLEMDKKE